jgi:molecular chaperone HscB
VSSSIPEYFALFGLEPQFALDQDRLTQNYRAVLAQVHPDRFAGAGPMERRAAVQIASHANQAYQVLRSDSARAAYLCAQNGTKADGEGTGALEPSFLELQMHWRESLADAVASSDINTIESLAAEVGASRVHLVEQIAQAIDMRRDFPAAAKAVRALMFVDKMNSEIERARHGEGASIDSH